ncbi:GGDEF domain-containing protein [Parasphingorhabdus sp.]|uniref:GGDEF domain-containing protein n=1 Tax=Parasphingorhabdus sp. TaxID=2709688 RepID=UPI003A8FF452
MQQHHESNDHECVNCRRLQQEIIALKEELAEMKRHAYHDALTGLSNRRFFIENVENRISRCMRYGDKCALLFLDVDNLKAINDKHGHVAGDLVLVRLSEILKRHTRTSDVVARIGGDEFGLLLDNLDRDQVLAKIAFFMKRFSTANCTLNGKQLPLGAAIGYCFVGPQDTVEGLMSRADAAMYRAKDKFE